MSTTTSAYLFFGVQLRRSMLKVNRRRKMPKVCENCYAEYDTGKYCKECAGRLLTADPADDRVAEIIDNDRFRWSRRTRNKIQIINTIDDISWNQDEYDKPHKDIFGYMFYKPTMIELGRANEPMSVDKQIASADDNAMEQLANALKEIGIDPLSHDEYCWWLVNYVG
ncbi:MAG: hypothetical protein AMS21_01035 [Gemmatimonas sp. SG8_38_2]|nr:MAG: hypothetical protein AMS21_01035 [Gemmatimonas sp. SG8_38_2]